MYSRLAGRARHSAADGFAAATIELPGSGDRPPSADAERARTDLRRAIKAGERPAEEVVDALILALVEQAVPEWQATLDALLSLPEIGGPVGHSGGVIAIGIRLAVVEPRIAAAAITATERPSDVRVADDYPTEFSVGVAQGVGAEKQFGPFFLHRSEDDVVVGEIGGAFVDEKGTIEIGYAVVESHWNRGFATAAVEALVTKAREATEVRHIVAHTPLKRPQSGRVLERAGFAMVREMEDSDDAGNVVRVVEGQLAV